MPCCKVSDTLLPECLILLRVVLPFSGANNTPSSPPTARPKPNDTQIPLLFMLFILKVKNSIAQPNGQKPNQIAGNKTSG
jgi:hypothetical protein